MRSTVDKRARAGDRKLLNEQIGTTARVILKARGMTARQLGDQIDEAETTVSKLLAGRQDWKADHLRDIPAALGVEMQALYDAPHDALCRLGMSEERPVRRVGVPRPMPDGDVRRVLREAPEPLRSWYALAVHAGLRACEIAAVHRRDVGAAVLVIPVQKGGGSGVVPLSCIPLPVLVANQDAEGWWFPHGHDSARHVTGAQVSKRANRWLHDAGVAHTLHSLRHSFGSAAYRESGYDLLLTADLMRHRRLDTTRGYAKLEPDRASNVGARMAGLYEVA